MSGQALAGLTVLDLTHYIAGPYCTRTLAGLGADVIKVEKPGEGDGARRLGPFYKDEAHPEKSLLFHFLNSGKRGITLNLKSQTGVKILKDLAQGVDILVENFRPGVLANWGIGYETLREINSGLIMTSISNFGQTGPYRDFLAADIVAYAMGGLMYTTGAYDREPVKHGLSQAQMIAGANAVVGTLTSLYSQQETGEGQQVDVSLQEGVLGIQASMPVTYGYNGAVTRRQARRGSGYGNIMPCRDGYFVPVASHVDWDMLVEFMGLPELGEPKFSDPNSRAIHKDELDAILGAQFLERTKQDLFHSAQEWRFPWAMVQDSEDLANCPQLEARGLFVEIDHPATGSTKHPGAPLKMSETPWQVECPAPLLGQHNQDIFCGRLGYGKEDMVRLREQGII